MSVSSLTTAALAITQAQTVQSIQLAVAKKAFQAEANVGNALLQTAQNLQAAAQGTVPDPNGGPGQIVDRTV